MSVVLNTLSLKDTAISLTLVSEEASPLSLEDLRQTVQHEVEIYLDESGIAAPFGPAVAARRPPHAFSLTPDHTRAAYTIHLHDPQAWLDCQLGKDEFIRVLSSSTDLLLHDIEQLQFGRAVDNLLTHNQIQREQAFEKMYIIVPVSPSGMLTNVQMQGKLIDHSQGGAFLYGKDTVLSSAFSVDVSAHLPAHLTCMTVSQARQVLGDHLFDIVDSRALQPAVIPSAFDIHRHRLIGNRQSIDDLSDAIMNYSHHAGFIEVLAHRMGNQLTPSFGMYAGHMLNEKKHFQLERNLGCHIDKKIAATPDGDAQASALSKMYQESPIVAFFTGMTIGQQYQGSNIANTRTWQSLHLSGTDHKLDHARPMLR